MNKKPPASFPKDWRTTQVSAIASVRGGKRLPAGEEFADGETPFPYLRVTDMVNGTIDDSNIAFVKPEIQPFIRQYKISCNDLYATIAGTLGQFGRIPPKFDDAQLTENAVKITDIDRSTIDLDFLCYFLRSDSVSAQVSIATGIGAGVPKLPLYQVERLRIAFPNNLPQQRKIAAILTTVDNLIEKTEALIAKYQAVKQGMMHDLFTRGIDQHGHLRPPYDEAPELYKQSELGWIPKEWDEPTFDDVTPLDAPICYGIVQPGEHDEKGIPVVAIYNLKTDFTGLHRSSPSIESKYVRSRIRGGDVLLSVKGTTGRVDIVPDWFEGNISRDIARIRPTRDVVAEYLRQMLACPHFQRHLETAIVGTTRAELSIGVLRRLALILPPEDEQGRIATAFESADSRLRSEHTHLGKLRCLKTGLMQDLLTGKVRVDVDEDEDV
ncbi:MAG: restriction endonuclease subunit S [Candidatus Nealsonbacteria bacterium]|nr:restriction endonuclease subunit S [Candidatus Nealsonbacteria bacterium]